MEQWKCLYTDHNNFTKGKVYEQSNEKHGTNNLFGNKLLDNKGKIAYGPLWYDPKTTVFEKVTKQTQNKYTRTVPSLDIDVYNVLKAFEVTDQAIGHAIKKLLAGGKRGHKDMLTDWQEAIDSIARAIEIEKETHE